MVPSLSRKQVSEINQGGPPPFFNETMYFDTLPWVLEQARSQPPLPGAIFFFFFFLFENKNEKKIGKK